MPFDKDDEKTRREISLAYYAGMLLVIRNRETHFSAEDANTAVALHLKYTYDQPTKEA